MATVNPDYRDEFWGLGESDSSISGHLIDPPSQVITLDEFATTPYVITGFTAKTSAGTVAVSIRINGVDVTGVSFLTITTTQVEYLATANRQVVKGDRVTLVMSATAAANFAFTLAARG